LKSFDKICAINLVNLPKEYWSRLKELSKQDMSTHDSIPRDDKEFVEMVGDADCALVSLTTEISANAIKKCPRLKYIGMYGTSLHRIDQKAAQANSIKVTNVTDYCEWETAEFVLAELLALARGLNGLQWKKRPCSIKGRSIGIIGMGHVGSHVAEIARRLEMKVCYFSRTRKPDEEKKGAEFLPVAELLQKAEVVSLHTPPHTMILGEGEFKQLGNGKVLINTCIGEALDTSAFLKWISHDDNRAVFDLISACNIEGILDLKNVVTYQLSAFESIEASRNLSDKFMENMQSFLGGS